MFVYLGQLLAQFKNTALLSCPLFMHMYMFLCFIHGQISNDDDGKWETWKMADRTALHCSSDWLKRRLLMLFTVWAVTISTHVNTFCLF